MVAECARWGESKRYTPDTWHEHLDRVRVGMIPERTAVVIQQLRAAGYLPAVDAPMFHVNGVAQHGGAIQRTEALALTVPRGTIYCTLDGSDPRRPADPMAGFEGDLTADLAPSAIHYTAPFGLTDSGPVKARAWADGTWSALSEALFAVGPVVESLRVSEIMYHPAETGEPNDAEAEFIELTNVGTESLSLNLVQFTAGIEFTFPPLELAPGAYVLVVKDANVFEARYGADLPVAGQFTGSLSNSGECLVLRDAIGRVILDFAYSDDWYRSTDGDGFSLTATAPELTDPTAWSDPATWAPSASVGGSPGCGPR